ncbi:hypothetical protein AAC387_Pa02g1433 [Persea americana]
MLSLAAMISISDIVFFHAMDMILYDHLVRTMGVDPEVTKQVITLWLWMESIGYPQLIRQISTYTDDALRRVVAEGEACLRALHSEMEYPVDSNDIPITAHLAKEPINLRFFRYNKDVVIQGIMNVSNKVCRIIFDDNIMRTAARDANHPMSIIASPTFKRQDGEGTSQQGASTTLGAPMAVAAPDQATDSSWLPCEMGQVMEKPLESSLNPYAMPWSPSLGKERLEQKLSKEPEHKRSIFLTFSTYYHFSKEEIVEFFISYVSFLIFVF